MPQPDYARIAQLERELGIGDDPPRRPVVRGPKVCLIKGCDGDTTELSTWSGFTLRVHEH